MRSSLRVDRKEADRGGHSERVKPAGITLQQLFTMRPFPRDTVSPFIFVPSLKSYTLYYAAAQNYRRAICYVDIS